MTHAEAMEQAFKRAKYFHRKYYVWAFVGARCGTILYTYSQEKPQHSWEDHKRSMRGQGWEVRSGNPC